MNRILRISLVLIAALLMCLSWNPKESRTSFANAISSGDICRPDQRGADLTDFNVPCLAGPSLTSLVPQPTQTFRTESSFSIIGKKPVAFRELPVSCATAFSLLFFGMGDKLLHALMNLRL
jgi:hypothetical protein